MSSGVALGEKWESGGGPGSRWIAPSGGAVWGSTEAMNSDVSAEQLDAVGAGGAHQPVPCGTGKLKIGQILGLA